jgi:hypothetical protein
MVTPIETWAPNSNPPANSNAASFILITFRQGTVTANG